jgi:hypothetical protein
MLAHLNINIFSLFLFLPLFLLSLSSAARSPRTIHRSHVFVVTSKTTKTTLIKKPFFNAAKEMSSGEKEKR